MKDLIINLMTADLHFMQRLGNIELIIGQEEYKLYQ